MGISIVLECYLLCVSGVWLIAVRHAERYFPYLHPATDMADSGASPVDPLATASTVSNRSDFD